MKKRLTFYKYKVTAPSENFSGVNSCNLWALNKEHAQYLFLEKYPTTPNDNQGFALGFGKIERLKEKPKSRTIEV